MWAFPESNKLSEIATHKKAIWSSLTLYFSTASPNYPGRFVTYAANEVTEELRERLKETDLTSSLTVLASVEAAFRMDYLERCYRKGKDPVSRAFRDIYKNKLQHVSLEDEIFEVWANNLPGARPVIGELRGAFRFRHWLAHGRYWTPKWGRRYNFDDVFALADLTLSSFPFCEFA